MSLTCGQATDPAGHADQGCAVMPSAAAQDVQGAQGGLSPCNSLALSGQQCGEWAMVPLQTQLASGGASPPPPPPVQTNLSILM